MITKIFYEQLGLLCVPFLECLKGRFMVQVFLWDVTIIQVAEAFEDRLDSGNPCRNDAVEFEPMPLS